MPTEYNNYALTHSSVLFPAFNVEGCTSTGVNSRNGARYYARDKYTNNLFEVRLRLLLINSERNNEQHYNKLENKEDSSDRSLLTESTITVSNGGYVYYSPCYDTSYSIPRWSINNNNDSSFTMETVQEWSKMITRTAVLITSIVKWWVESLLPSMKSFEVEQHLQYEWELLSELSSTLSFCPAHFLSVALPLEVYVVKRQNGKDCCVCSIEPIAGLSLGDIVRSGWRVVAEETLNAILVAVNEFGSICWYLPEHHNLSSDSIKQVMTVRDGVTERFHSSRWVVSDWSLVPDYNYKEDEFEKWLEFGSVQFCEKQIRWNLGSVIQIKRSGSAKINDNSRLESFTGLCSFLIRREKYVNETIQILEHILLASFSEVNVSSSCQDGSFLSPMHVEEKIMSSMEQMQAKAKLLVERAKATLTKLSTFIVRGITVDDNKNSDNNNNSEHNAAIQQESCEHTCEVRKSGSKEIESLEHEEFKSAGSTKENHEQLTETFTTNDKPLIQNYESKTESINKDLTSLILATNVVKQNSLEPSTLPSSENSILRHSAYASAIKSLQDLMFKEKLTLHQNALRNEQLLINRYRRRNAPLPPLPNNNSELSFVNDGSTFVNNNNYNKNSNNNNNANNNTFSSNDSNNNNNVVIDKRLSNATEHVHNEEKCIKENKEEDNCHHSQHVDRNCNTGSDKSCFSRDMYAIKGELEHFSGSGANDLHKNLAKGVDTRINAKWEVDSNENNKNLNNDNCMIDERIETVVNRTVKVNDALFDIKPLSVLCNNTNITTNEDNLHKSSENADSQSFIDFSECQHINSHNKNSCVESEQETRDNENDMEWLLNSVMVNTMAVDSRVTSTRNYLHSVLSRNAFMLASHNSENYQCLTHSPSQEHFYGTATCNQGNADAKSYSALSGQHESNSRDVQNRNYLYHRTRISSSPYSANSISANSISAMAAGLNTSYDSSFNSSVRLSPLTVSLSAVTTLSRDAVWSASHEKMAMSSQRRGQEEMQHEYTEHQEHSNQRAYEQSLEKEWSPHSEFKHSEGVLQNEQSCSEAYHRSNTADNNQSKLSRYELKHSTTRILFDVNDNENDDNNNSNDNDNTNDVQNYNKYADINYIKPDTKDKYNEKTANNNKADDVRNGDDHDKGDNSKNNVSTEQNRMHVLDNADMDEKNNEFTRDQNMLEHVKKWNTSTKSESITTANKHYWNNYLTEKRQKGHLYKRLMPAAELAKNANDPFSFAERAMYQPRQRFDRDVYQCHFKRMANKIVPEDVAETQVDKSIEHTTDNNNNSAELSNDNNNYVPIEEVGQENVIAASNNNIHHISNALEVKKETEENKALPVEATQDLTPIPPQHSIKTVLPHSEQQNIIHKTTATTMHTHHATLPTNTVVSTTDIIDNKNEKGDENKYNIDNSKNSNKKKDVNNHQHYHYNANVSANQSSDKSDCNRVIVTRAPVKSKIMRYRKMWTANHLEEHNESEDMPNTSHAATNLPKALYSVTSKLFQQRKQRLEQEQQKEQSAREEMKEKWKYHEEDVTHQVCEERNELAGINSNTTNNSASNTERSDIPDEVYANAYVNYDITPRNRRHNKISAPTAFIRLPTNTSSINISSPVQRPAQPFPVQPITRQIHRRISTTKIRRRSSDNATSTYSARSAQSKKY